MSVHWGGRGPGHLSRWPKSVGLNPAVLFANGEKGVAFDPSNFGTVSQASAGTGAPAFGAPVGREMDISPNAKHAVQATDAGRPILAGNGRTRLLYRSMAMATPAIDFTGTNKITVLTYVRKFSDALLGMAIELSANGFTTNGGFYVSAPNTNTGNSFGFAAKGSAAAAYTATTYAAPYGAVLECVFDISGATLPDKIKPKVDGVVPSVSATGTTLGTGNFGNHVLNLGARNGATLGLNGAIGRTIIIGRELTVAERAIWVPWISSEPALGEGILAAVGDSTVAAYLGQFSVTEFIDVNAANMAVAGHTIAQQKAVWQARPDKASFATVIVQVGANDCDPAIPTATTIAAYQDLIDTITGDVSVPVYVSGMTPCKADLMTVYGGVNGPLAYQKWLDLNAAIAGQGATPITGVDGRIMEHVALMNDGAGNLRPEYDSGDGIHPLNPGKNVNATSWYNRVKADQVL